MSALVGYASSDEESDAEQQSQAQPIASNGNTLETTINAGKDETTTASPAAPVTVLEDVQPASAYAPTVTTTQVAHSTNDGPPLSPYSANRAQLQSLTMPQYPNFDIPPSPSPPPTNSEEAAELTARTRKFERFLELKKQGIHFNDRLAASQALRNPDLLLKLADFAGIEPEDQYENTLGEQFAVPTRWPAGFLEGLVASNDKKNKKDKTGRKKLEFTPASSKASRA